MKHFLHLLLLLPTLAANAQPMTELARDPVWLKLGHYEADRRSPTGWTSAIHDPSFFLATDGQQNPQAELSATLEALAKPTTGNDSAACRFPARQIWLQEQLQQPFAKSECSEFDQWTRNQSIDSVSIVYATGYLGNPASFYGHTLLKFNYADRSQATGLMDAAVNYGAILEGRIDPVSYIVKGILGGYDGGFTQIGYYYHNHNYGENELRDLWEYELNLPAESVAFIAAHAWEVLGKRYTYYFFRHNCAYRMAELLQLRGDINIIPANRPWTIPQSLILALEDQAGSSLIANIHYHPSRQSRFYSTWSALSDNEQDAVRIVALGKIELDQVLQEFSRPEQQQAVTETLLDYYQLLQTTKNKGQAEYQKTLATRFSLPAGNTRPSIEPPAAPHQSRSPGWVQFSSLWSGKTHKPAIQLRLRPAYYDALDSAAGHVHMGRLSMGELTLRVSDNRLRVHQFDAIAIDSISPGISGLPGDRGKTWSLRLGAEQQRLACTPCLVPRFSGSMGVGRMLSNTLHTDIALSGALHHDRIGQGNHIIGPQWRLHYRPDNANSARLLVAHNASLQSNGKSYQTAELEIRRKLSPRMDARFNWQWDSHSEVTMGLGWYW